MDEMINKLKSSSDEDMPLFSYFSEWWKNFALELLDRLSISEAQRQAAEAKHEKYKHIQKCYYVAVEGCSKFEKEVEELKEREYQTKQDAEREIRRKKEQVRRLLEKLRYHHRRRQKRAREYKAQLAAGTRTRKKKVAPPAEPVVPVADEPGEPGEEGGSDASVQ
ncbi:hypothetical protein AC781_11470 [Akkermansia glycaniphila]|nr:hypothetical protein AC781_11470 [Akkermansia glycaniphila]